jgi:hypothetical protein
MPALVQLAGDLTTESYCNDSPWSILLAIDSCRDSNNVRSRTFIYIMVVAVPDRLFCAYPD